MRLILGDKKIDEQRGTWSRTVWIESDIEGDLPRVLRIHHRRGKRVRIPYKPKGPEAYGFHWYAEVYESGRCEFSERVGKSLGCRGILRLAGMI